MEWLIIAYFVGVLVAAFGIRSILKRKANKVPDEWAPRPVDPNAPPQLKRYKPRPGRPTLRCTNSTCFRTLVPGEDVLLWPLKDGGYDLLCTDCWKIQKQ